MFKGNRKEPWDGKYDVSEAEWRLIAPLLPNRPPGIAQADDRRAINGIFYVLRAGSPWRDLPEGYGPYTTVYNRQSPQLMQIIASSIIRFTGTPPAEKGGGITALVVLVGGLSTEIHAVADQDVTPVRLLISPG